ncbi:hypothetical protein ACK4RR_18720 [Proteus mirabilis]
MNFSPVLNSYSKLNFPLNFIELLLTQSFLFRVINPKKSFQVTQNDEVATVQ